MRIDPHVHFRDQEQNYKETIAHGLQTAKEQGVDLIFDMPNTFNPVLTEKDVNARLKLVPKKEKSRYFTYIGATSNEKQLKQAINIVNKKKKVIGIKLFAGKSVGNLEITDEQEQKKVYQILAENNYKGVLAVHCEKESYIKDIFNPNNPITHSFSRPNIAEIESIKDQIAFAKQSNFKGILHICHVSCKESVKLIDNARKHIRITCAITPHHLHWDNSKLKGPHGLLYKMNPPLRSKEDVKALQIYLKQGKIDWIETDHAPHTIGEKLHKGYPSGYPSLYLYKKCVEEFLPSLGLTEKQINDLTFSNIVKAFDLKGKIIK
ncbi:amidohydrolase family protein [Candidatus Woesearchaeota archaeon]|nr:amidohydrolase family protein [Candidatus Woesearchaeota archaeon]